MSEANQDKRSGHLWPAGLRAPAVEVRLEADGRWFAEVRKVPGVIAYGRTPGEAADDAVRLWARVMVERGVPQARLALWSVTRTDS